MSINLGHRPDCPAPWVNPATLTPAKVAALAARLRTHLREACDGLSRGAWALHRPMPVSVCRGEGHFHLAPELFIQLAGWTHFELPQGGLRLHGGEVLLLPARLRHDERIGPGPSGEPFANLVVYADGSALSCHLAHEHGPGQPGILHLEARQHPQAARVLAWLGDAAAQDADDPPPDAPAQLQARALVLAALAGVRRMLDEPDSGVRASHEPPLLARLRVLVHNQLGDHTLSVRRLAEQSGCSADHLSYRFREATGEPLVAFITRLRMERAVRLLAETDLAVKEVAWACGYTTPSYFIRSFRTHHGTTPLAWRAARPGG